MGNNLFFSGRTFKLRKVSEIFCRRVLRNLYVRKWRQVIILRLMDYLESRGCLG